MEEKVKLAKVLENPVIIRPRRAVVFVQYVKKEKGSLRTWNLLCLECCAKLKKRSDRRELIITSLLENKDKSDALVCSRKNCDSLTRI